MSDSANLSVVRRLYEGRGNPEVIRQVLASDVRWEVVDGFPYGAVYVGLESVLRDFFGRLFTDFGYTYRTDSGWTVDYRIKFDPNSSVQEIG